MHVDPSRLFAEDIWFSSCLCIMLHISVGLLYNHCQNVLKNNKKYSRGCKFSVILREVIFFSPHFVLPQSGPQPPNQKEVGDIAALNLQQMMDLEVSSSSTSSESISTYCSSTSSSVHAKSTKEMWTSKVLPC
jgi:hypothetical protein